jgi:hypothetical protein
MLRSRRTRNQVTTILATLAVVGIAAIAFVTIQFPERPLLLSAWTGLASAVIIVTPLAYWILFGVRTALGRALRRLPLLAYLAINALLLSVLLLVGHYVAHDLVWPHRGHFFGSHDIMVSLIFLIALMIAIGIAIAASSALAAGSESWRRDFGAVPRMRGALHAGEVLCGEIGDLKREITVIGDTLNTAARIADEARKHDGLMLASAEALAGAALPAGVTRVDLGAVALRGNAEPVALALLRASP